MPDETPPPKTGAKDKSPPPATGLGTVDLLVVPEADLYLDGFQSGRVRARIFSLEAGKHTLRLVNHALKKEVMRRITVVPGQTTYVDVNMNEE